MSSKFGRESWSELVLESINVTHNLTPIFPFHMTNDGFASSPSSRSDVLNQFSDRISLLEHFIRMQNCRLSSGGKRSSPLAEFILIESFRATELN